MFSVDQVLRLIAQDAGIRRHGVSSLCRSPVLRTQAATNIEVAKRGSVEKPGVGMDYARV